MSPKRILVIAGSDCSGGAGLEADQKVIAAHGCYAMTATTALTAQNTLGVQDIHQIPPLFLEKQINACIDDIGVDVVKTGMLASSDAISVVARAFQKYSIVSSVVDPVMVSTSGSQLLPSAAISTLIEVLLPLTNILTPNLPEAKLLLRTAKVPFMDPQSVDDIIEMVKKLQQLGPKYVLLKGGHMPLTKGRVVSKNQTDNDVVLNVLYGEAKTTVIEAPYQNSKNTHGTGCSLASAIACNIALGLPMVDAVKKANRYIEAGIKTSRSIGKGNGPINHFHSTYTLPFGPGGFVDYVMERADVRSPWHAYTHHEFVQRMANNTLATENFKYYLVQDYLFLIHFARANALASYKSKSMVDIGRSAQQVLHLQEEIKLHIELCNEYGLQIDEVENNEEDQACTAYTRYVLDIGQSEDWIALQVALLPCLIGYGMIARRLHDDPKTIREGSRYWKWIEAYVSEDYCAAMKVGQDLVEEHAMKQSVSRIEELTRIFIHATNMERGFWDMGLKASPETA